MVRKYVHKKSARLSVKARDERMTRAVELRGLDLSLREIAGRLAVSYQTVARDLARWERERPNVTPLAVTPDCHKVPPGRQEVTPSRDSSDAEVVQIRRSS